MHFDFRPLLRRTFAKISLFTDPGHQQGVLERNANTRALGAWLSQSFTFGNLAATFGTCLLRLQKASLSSDSSIRMSFRTMVFCCREASPLEARLLPTKGKWLSKSTATQGTEPESNRNSLVPFSCRTPGGSGWQPLHNEYYIVEYPTFANKSVTFANSKKKLSHGFPT